MSRPEPGLPVDPGARARATTANPPLELNLGQPSHHTEPNPPAARIAHDQTLMNLGKWRRPVGLALLGVTILGWTSSNFLASAVFADHTYSKPYFVTYINTSFFIIPLIPIFIKKAYQNPEELQRWAGEIRSRLRIGYAPIRQDDGDGTGYGHSPLLRPRTRSSNTDALLDDPTERSQVLSAKDLLAGAPTDPSHAPLSMREISRLSLEFCLLWFLANYFIAACLQYTTVASSTILTSTSSVFTLFFGAMFKVERFTLRKLFGVLASLTGIIVIASLDVSGSSSDDKHRGDFPKKSLRERAIGDCLALLSALMYGLYAVFMKKRIGDETRVDMPVFFGFVGIINVLILWPGLFIFHWAGIERFEWPPTWSVTLIVLCNSLLSLIGDVAWAYAVLLTSPIVVTVGLSFTIPLSLVAQFVLHDQRTGVWYWLGASIVVLSFLFINHEEKKDEDFVPLPVTEDGMSASSGP